MKINLKAEKTEYEWQKIIDKFWLIFTPNWFNWLSWVLIIGAITYLAEKSNNILLNVAEIISYLSLFHYLQAFFYSLEFHGIPFIKNEKVRRAISLLISAFLASGIFLFLSKLVFELKGKS